MGTMTVRVAAVGAAVIVGVVVFKAWANRFQVSKENSIDYEAVSTQKPTIVTLTPERRTVLVVPQAYSGANTGLRTCPEPPPDVAEALTTAVAAGLKADAGEGANTELKMSHHLDSAIVDRIRCGQWSAYRQCERCANAV